MENDGVWVPLTPRKSALSFEQGTGKCTDCFDTRRFMEMCVMNEMGEFPDGLLDVDGVVFGAAGEDPKGTAAVQDDTSYVQEKTVKISLSEDDNKKAHGAESEYDIGSIPTPAKTKETRKRRSDGIDMNKKPSQRPRVKKHRPKILDDSTPKKVPKARTPRATSRTKTPKPATPNRVQERKMRSRKNKSTSSSNRMQKSTGYGFNDAGQDVPEASGSSIVLRSCKRVLDFDCLPIYKESKSHEKPASVGFEFKHFGCFRDEIVTSKRNTPRRSKFLNKEDISVRRTPEQVDSYGRKYICFYQRRKKTSAISTRPVPTVQVYQRSFRANQCLQNSRKCGPNFPKLFKKQRMMIKTENVKVNQWRIVAEDLHKSLIRRSRKLMQATRKNVQKRVDKSTDKKQVVKPNLYTDELLPLFLHPRRKRSIMRTRLRGSIIEFPCDLNDYILCQEENTLQINKLLSSLQEVPVQIIRSFTSPHQDFPRFDNFVGYPNRLQLQEAVVLESQSLPPEHLHILHTREDLNEFISSEVEQLIGKLKSLDINDQCKELMVRDMNVSGALVKVLPGKKRKVIPKVDLDTETLRVWKLLMENENDESEHVEEIDKDKEEWWETQRNIFRGRVDSFIAKMHLIQGNRRFSPWKGSVTDSVVGVYLTQNVVDHFSSSAFMSVAARYPADSRSKEVNENFEVPNSQESIASNTKVYEGFSKNNEMEQDMHTSSTNVSVANPTMECNQNPVQARDLPCANENFNTFRKLLEVEEVNYLKQFCGGCIDVDLWETSESRSIGQQKSTPGEEPKVVSPNCSLQSDVTTEQGGDSATNHKETPVEEPKVVSPDCSHQSDITTEQGGDSATNHKETPVEVNVVEPKIVSPNCSPQSDITTEQGGDSATNHKETPVEKSTPPEEPKVDSPNFCLQSGVTTEKGGDSATNHKETHVEKSTPVEEPKAVSPNCSPQSDITTEQGGDSATNHKETPVEVNIKGKNKNRKEKKQEPETDWEELRRTHCKTGEKETHANYRDAVDWDAVRHASIEEIAELIVDRGMNNVIAKRIKDFLDRIYKDHGTLDLEWLRDVPPDRAKEFLLSIEGLGLKSVECVRLLTLHHNAFPVDTNVGRVATRLGWVPLQPLPDAVQIHLLNAYPMVDKIQKYLYPRLCTLDQKTLYELHYQLITFGKVFCTKIKPNCGACPMRAECRHYASAFASGRLALPGTKESNVTSIVLAGNQENQSLHSQPPSSFDPEVNNLGSAYQSQSQTCEPIIEVPPSPEPEVESIIGDIEDLCCESDDDEIPIIRLNTQEFRETLKETISTNNISIPDADMSNALVAWSAEHANIHVPRKKFVAKSRTMHLVYELPDNHPLLAGFEKREDDDPTPYLLAIWLPDEIRKSIEYAENRAFVAANDNLEETVKATILIPCRTANRGRFPLNGTYFQVNEVFADDETSHSPMDVQRSLLCDLRLRELGCGPSATSIFKALSTGAIQRLFWRGSICVRGFNRKTRRPRPLHPIFHISTAARNRNNAKKSSTSTM